ncbi:MAG TPA: hypothetical protein VL992_15040 [Tepidisphaeraceae bacterium]|nr:hypothetical protein [Tepidisphaeraceae bacterium]
MAREFTSGCWVDVYACACFAGKLKRIYGPGRIRIGRVGSLIVGPDARVVAAGASLRPKQLVPDLDAARWKGKLDSFEVQHVAKQ